MKATRTFFAGILGVALTLTVAPIGMAIADEKNQIWGWYYSAFGSLELSPQIFIRSGTATVEFSNQNVRISIKDKKIPELTPSFVGKIEKNGTIKGMLKGFFFHEPESMSGIYRKTTIEDCHFAEIILRPLAADGSVFALSKVTGSCNGNTAGGS